MSNQHLPHANARPDGVVIDTIVIHSMYSPNSTDPLSPTQAIDLLNHHKVAAHYLIDRLGNQWCLVPENLRAWHAGESTMPFEHDQRGNVNDFSIGIELIGRPDQTFTKAQYTALRSLCFELMMRYPIRAIVGHDQIAPGRKTDPGKFFDWSELKSLQSKTSPYLSFA